MDKFKHTVLMERARSSTNISAEELEYYSGYALYLSMKDSTECISYELAKLLYIHIPESLQEEEETKFTSCIPHIVDHHAISIRPKLASRLVRTYA